MAVYMFSINLVWRCFRWVLSSPKKTLYFSWAYIFRWVLSSPNWVLSSPKFTEKKPFFWYISICYAKMAPPPIYTYI